MDTDQRRKIESEIGKLYRERETYLACGDIEKFNRITREIAKLDRALRGAITNEKETENHGD